MKLTNFRDYAILTSISLFLSFGMVSVSQSASVAEFNAAFVEANDLRKQSNQLKHEWRDTAKLLREAQKLAQDGDLDQAMKLVSEAKMQSEAAIYQAKREQKLWEGRVIR